MSEENSWGILGNFLGMPRNVLVKLPLERLTADADAMNRRVLSSQGLAANTRASAPRGELGPPTSLAARIERATFRFVGPDWAA